MHNNSLNFVSDTPARRRRTGLLVGVVSMGTARAGQRLMRSLVGVCSQGWDVDWAVMRVGVPEARQRTRWAALRAVARAFRISLRVDDVPGNGENVARARRMPTHVASAVVEGLNRWHRARRSALGLHRWCRAHRSAIHVAAIVEQVVGAKALPAAKEFRDEVRHHIVSCTLLAELVV